jgi:cytochrome c-type biogenesis protein CcmH
MAEPPKPPPRPVAATVALAGAGLLALASVVFAVSRPSAEASAEGPAAEANGQQAASAEEMIPQLQERLRQNPDDDEAWFTLGLTYREQRRVREAEQAFRRAMELRPQNADYTGYLAESLFILSEGNPPPEAERLFRRVLELRPRHPQARYYLATLRDIRGDHRGAIDDLVALLREAPPGAPWEPQVREAATRIAAANRIDLAGRLPAAPAQTVATAAIPGPTREQMEAARSIPPSQQQEMVKGMVDRLAARLRDEPRNADGWMMLMRSRMTLNEPQRAAEALRSGLAAFADDPAAQQRLRAAAQQLGVPAG